jgi:hypothetical protein
MTVRYSVSLLTGQAFGIREMRLQAMTPPGMRNGGADVSPSSTNAIQHVSRHASQSNIHTFIRFLRFVLVGAAPGRCHCIRYREGYTPKGLNEPFHVSMTFNLEATSEQDTTSPCFEGVDRRKGKNLPSVVHWTAIKGSTENMRMAL